MAMEPPAEIVLTLEEALQFVEALEDSRDALLTTDHLAEVALVETVIGLLNRKLGFPGTGGDDDDE